MIGDLVAGSVTGVNIAVVAKITESDCQREQKFFLRNRSPVQLERKLNRIIPIPAANLVSEAENAQDCARGSTHGGPDLDRSLLVVQKPRDIKSPGSPATALQSDNNGFRCGGFSGHGAGDNSYHQAGRNLANSPCGLTRHRIQATTTL